MDNEMSIPKVYTVRINFGKILILGNEVSN